MKTINEVAAIIIKDGEILVTQCKYDDYTGMYKFPSGKIELGESPEKALVRKVRVELSVTIKVVEWIGTVEYDHSTSHYVMRAFLCCIIPEEQRLNEYASAIWVTYRELDNINWIPEYKKLIEKISMRLEWKTRFFHTGREEIGDLYSYVSEGTKTIELMDKFEGKDRPDGPYKRLIFKNVRKDKIGDFLCEYHLIVERYSDVDHTEGNITFTEFKKDNGRSVYYYCSTQLREALKQNGKILKEKEFYFYKPYYFRAQNSSNREGYGWEWDWSGGLGIPEEGTYYGETDNYAFVGVQIESSVRKGKKTHHKKNVPTYQRIESVIYQSKPYFKIYKNEQESFLIPREKGMTKEKAIALYKANISTASRNQ